MAATAAAADAPAEPEIEDDVNPYVIGNEVTIGNNLRNEFGIRGVVIRSGVTRVTIRNATTRNTYTRAWFNLNPTGAGARAEQR